MSTAGAGRGVWPDVERSQDHLWSLGEYVCHLPLYWSDVLWPTNLPTFSQVQPGDVDPAARLDQPAWDELVGRIEVFKTGLPNVRKVLATVPSLMLLDDHEVTDDWNLNYLWTASVYGNARGQRLVCNGLLAYTLFQHWGNVPTRFATAGTPEAQILTSATFNAGASPDTPALRTLLGSPQAAPPAPPSVLRNLSVRGSVRYDVTLTSADGYPLRIVLLDERTAREFVRPDHPAARISHAALSLMLPTPPPVAEPLTLVVCPSPACGSHVIEHVIQPASSLLPGGSVYTDFESWSGETSNHQDLLARLAAYQPVVVLSGDVHYGAVGKVTYLSGATTSHMAQLTTSAARNADAKTMALHLLGDFGTKIGVERTRRFAGFNALTVNQRTQLASPPPAPAALPYDDVVDIALGRVFRAEREQPAVLSLEVATVYGFGAGDFSATTVPGTVLSAPSTWRR